MSNSVRVEAAPKGRVRLGNLGNGDSIYLTPPEALALAERLREVATGLSEPAGRCRMCDGTGLFSARALTCSRCGGSGRAVE